MSSELQPCRWSAWAFEKLFLPKYWSCSLFLKEVAVAFGNMHSSSRMEKIPIGWQTKQLSHKCTLGNQIWYMLFTTFKKCNVSTRWNLEKIKHCAFYIIWAIKIRFTNHKLNFKTFYKCAMNVCSL